MSDARLRSPGGPLSPVGEFSTNVTYNCKSAQLRIFVIDAEVENLLSRDAVTKLGLVQRLNSIKSVFGEIDNHPIKCNPVKIVLKEDYQPYSLRTPRRISIPLQNKVKIELARMEEAGVIQKVEEPTDWCSPMVVAMKKSGDVRICADFKKLNQSIKRERYMLPTPEDLLHKLKGSKVYSKLDATSGFWQIPLDESTAKPTTFITPYGRYFYRRLPFGISSAPEIFQRTMETLLEGQPNVICYFDDILIHSDSHEDHKDHLDQTTKTLSDAGLKLNKAKCEIEKEEIEFLGYIISTDGVRPDPGKVEAVVKMAEPTNVAELRCMLGMVNFLGRYIPHLSTVLHPLCELLGKDRAWVWGPAQAEVFTRVKELLTTAPTLAFFYPSKPTTVSSDARSYGLGSVLLQEHEDGVLRPVALCSRSLTPAERRYAQIEKECLAGVWACERFHRYLVGLDSFTLETDHKPLVPLINSRDLTDTPVRCQRMLLRIMRFNAQARYTPGKQLQVADALSRSPTEEGSEDKLEEVVDLHVNAVKAA